MSHAAAIQRRGLRDWLRWLGAGSEAASVWEVPGVTAAIVPVTPERSVINSVVYDGESSLAAAYDELVSVYANAGIVAWTVWTPEHDSGAIEFLTSNGHVFDGQPAAMTLDLERFESPGLGDLDWDMDASFEELGRINDSGYGHAGADGIAAAVAGAPDDVPIRLYRARQGDQTACVLGTIDHDDDLGVYFVASAGGHSRRGLASRLLTAALLEGRERGLRTSSLQSSAKGEPVYTRLGYRGRYRLHLYERRE